MATSTWPRADKNPPVAASPSRRSNDRNRTGPRHGGLFLGTKLQEEEDRGRPVTGSGHAAPAARIRSSSGSGDDARPGEGWRRRRPSSRALGAAPATNPRVPCHRSRCAAPALLHDRDGEALALPANPDMPSPTTRTCFTSLSIAGSIGRHPFLARHY